MSFSTTNLAVVFTTLLAGIFLFLPRPRHNRMRTATITPLASIIGSGFLVLAPLLDRSIGVAAGPMMLGLCVAAYLFGGTIRFNISSHDRSKRTPTTVLAMESFSSAALAFAYVVSVTYYLNLFGSFGVALTAFDTPGHGRWLATAAFAWVANVFEIIALASRAFAFYYALQCVVATVVAWSAGGRLKSGCFAALGLLGVLILIFGRSVE